jgi:hypothetical protein
MTNEECLQVIELVSIAQDSMKNCRFTKSQIRRANKIIQFLFGKEQDLIRSVLELQNDKT